MTIPKEKSGRKKKTHIEKAKVKKAWENGRYDAKIGGGLNRAYEKQA